MKFFAVALISIGSASFLLFMGTLAIGISDSSKDVPHWVMQWSLILGVTLPLLGVLVLPKRSSATQGFEVIMKEDTGEAPVLLEKKDDDHG